jgi:RNA polymerase sigma-70 factor (ECF subfamily)
MGVPAGEDSMLSDKRQDQCAHSVAEFEATALPHIQKLYRIAAWLAGDRTTAETLVQKTLTTALDSINELEAEVDACVWLITIMYQIKNNSHRSWWLWHRSSKIENADTVSEIANGVIAFEPRTPEGLTENEVLRALRNLGTQYQEVMLLSDIEELTYKETAEVLGITTAVLMMRLKNARKQMRAGLRANAANRDLAYEKKPQTI